MKTIIFSPTSPKRQTVRSMAALILCMFFFAVTGCNKDEFDESEIFTAKGVRVEYNEYCGFQLFHWGCAIHPGVFAPALYAPRNLPRAFQVEGLLVNVVFGHRYGERHRCGPYDITILQIEKVIYTSRFYVRKTEDFGYLLFEDFGFPEVDRILKPSCLPEEFRQDGLQVDVTFRTLSGSLWYEGRRVTRIEIISIMETPKGRAETRITGGDYTAIRYNPWQVLISQGDGNGHCGGTIIAPNLILTARHCIRNIHPSSFRVHAGITCRAEINSSNTFQVSRIIFHPDPNVDAALLQLSNTISFNNNRRAINYWASVDNSLYGIGRSVRTSGWGMTIERDPSSAAECLQTVYLQIIPCESASRVLNDYGYARLRPHERAATGTGNGRQGTCNGDSGGPFVTRLPSGEEVLIGIVARGRYLCPGINPRSPSVFVRASYLKPWILSTAPTISPVSPITGPTLLCSSAATFTVPASHNAEIHWLSSPNLRHINGGTFSVIHPSGAQASWVQAIVNGAPSNRHELWVGTPFISEVRSTPTHSNIKRFEAILPMMTLQGTLNNGFVWELDAPSCCAGFVGNTNQRTVDIQFHGSGFFSLTVAATNACGVGSPYWLNIFHFSRSGDMRESTTARAQSRPISGTFHVLLGYEADAREQSIFDVRIYDRRGNMVRQVVTEGGSVAFDLSDLPDGTYYLHICNGVGEPMIQPIVVENKG